MDSRLIQIDDWNFEIVQLRGRRVKKFGDKYNGIADITITDGVPHVEGLLCQEPKFSRNDYRAFTKLLVGMWGLDFEYHQVKSGVKKNKSVVAKNNEVFTHKVGKGWVKNEEIK
tara:strand:- start:164715 stop:165056 length:342 start_codon:yes stop_codon:yes gene_type:complete